MAVIRVLLLLLLAVAIASPSCSCMAYDQVRNVLYSGEILKSTETLSWGDRFVLRMQDNCDLCARGSRDWCSHTDGQGQNCYTRLQRDGDLVIYNNRHKRLWTSNTQSVLGDYVLVFQNNRNTILYSQSRWSAITKSNSTDPPAPEPEAYEERIKSVVGDLPLPKNILYSNETLKTGEQLSWGNYRLTMKTNCNLGLYHSEKQVWSTQTDRKGRDCYAAFGTDGNLVIYSGSNTRLWSTDIKWGEGSYVLILQKDGNVVIYGEERWSTDSSQ